MARRLEAPDKQWSIASLDTGAREGGKKRGRDEKKARGTDGRREERMNVWQEEEIAGDRKG